MIAPGIRVLRDKLFPIMVDHVNRAAVLDNNNGIQAGAAEVFQRREQHKGGKDLMGHGEAYGSMVVYVIKESDAR